jgi:hypothetical protein
MFKSLFPYPLLLFSLMMPFCLSTEAQELSRDTRNVEISVSQNTGHLLDWSQTDRRIKLIMIDNPELLTKKIVFNADGCSPKECKDASLLLISPRPAAGLGHGGTLRVITYDRKQKLYPYTISITITKQPQKDNETRFIVGNSNQAKS